MSAILKALQNRKVEVELKSEVVEFASVKDLDKQINLIKQSQKTIDSKVPALLKAGDSLNDAKDKLRNAVSDSEKLLNTFEKQAKELGVPVTSIPSYKVLEDEVKKGKNGRSESLSFFW